jgi:hypothetical protein
LKPCVVHNPHYSSYRQVGIPPPETRAVDRHADVGPDEGYVAREPGDGAEEVAKEDEDAVQLDQEPYQRPPQQYERQPREEGRRALGLVLAREEEERLGGSDYDCEADEEEDLRRREGYCV